MKKLIYYIIFWLGYGLYSLTKKTPYRSYISFRQLFVLTNGRLNDYLSGKISSRMQPEIIPLESSVLFTEITEEKINDIVKDINLNGFHLCKTKLSPELVGKLLDLAEKTEHGVMDKEGLHKYDREKIVSTKYYVPESKLVDDETVQSLLTDDAVLNIAQKYLKTIPISDMVTMWWSTTFEKKASSKAAQLFHFDMDRIKFIKFFVYLTDVDDDNGPHVYVRSSHKNLPDSLKHDGRMTDEEVASAYSKDDFVKIKGEKGTIFIADTRGIHKGQPLLDGERLMFQMEYTNSLFGAPYNDRKGTVTSGPLHDARVKYPKIFKRY